jgi:Protein of unknown function (DUF4232)
VHARLWLPLLLLLAVAAGCDSGSKKAQPGATGPAVPWTPAPPPQLPARAPVSQFCRSDNLAVRGEVKFVSRLQGGIALVSIWNTGKHACRLTGRPRVRLVHRGGPVQAQRAIPSTPSNFPEVAYPASSLLALRPGESAAVTVSWDNWCDLKVPGKPHVPPSALRITLPAGRGNVDADYNAVVPCLDPKSPSVIGVSRFQPTLVPRRGRPWSDAFVRASVPDDPHVKRGGILRFRVVLRNTSNITASFERCPAYVQQLVPAGKVEVYELNCRAAHPIAPGKSLAFAMQIRAPRGSPLGPNGLFWELDPFGIGAPRLHTRVVVGR